MPARPVTHAPVPCGKSLDSSLGSPPCSSSGPGGTARQFRQGLPWRMRLHSFLARQIQIAYTLWCEVRSLVHRIRTPRSRTGLLLPSEYLDSRLLQNRLVKNSAISASIACIESIKAQMPWVSLFDMSLVLQGWAAGAAWGVCNPLPRIDSCSEQQGNEASGSSPDHEHPCPTQR